MILNYPSSLTIAPSGSKAATIIIYQQFYNYIHLYQISKWSNKWGLKLNSSKTVEIVFTKRKISNIHKIKLLGKEINTASYTKFLPRSVR